MNRETINFIRSVLPKGRTVYYGFPDRYALLLLEYVIGEDECRIADLKKSVYSPLLNKPRLKSLLSNLGRSWIRSSDLINAWSTHPENYRLTLGTWPELTERPSQGWDQVTRWGWNLVLQLNFSTTHRRDLGGIVPDWKYNIQNSIHPISNGGELTLAWSRIDLDLETGEALIEEIQSDWVRDVKYYSESEYYNDQGDWKKYFEEFLKPQTKKWPETMLTATLWFLLKEIGIKTIFFHTNESGRQLKSIKKDFPPRSIYSDLPKKFCFQVTHNGPLFIRNSAKKRLSKIFSDPHTRWYIIDFNKKIASDRK